MLTLNNEKKKKQKTKQKQEEKKETCFLPRQIVPFPVKPSLQTQLYEPAVFTQSALTSHPELPATHSSLSA